MRTLALTSDRVTHFFCQGVGGGIEEGLARGKGQKEDRKGTLKANRYDGRSCAVAVDLIDFRTGTRKRLKLGANADKAPEMEEGIRMFKAINLRVWLVAICLAVTWMNASEASALKPVDCDEIRFLLRGGATSDFDQFVKLDFGKPVLDWTDDDFKSFRNLAMSCRASSTDESFFSDSVDESISYIRSEIPKRAIPKQETAPEASTTQKQRAATEASTLRPVDCGKILPLFKSTFRDFDGLARLDFGKPIYNWDGNDFKSFKHLVMSCRTSNIDESYFSGEVDDGISYIKSGDTKEGY